MRRLPGIALGLAAIGLSACSGGSEHVPSPDAREPIVVTVSPAAGVDMAERLEAGGVVAASESAAIASRIIATIAGVRVRPGDAVRAGDVLITLDARDVVERTAQTRASAVAAEKALSQARAEQQGAEADHRLARSWQERIAALHARNSATDQERDEAEARLAAAVARLTGIEAGIEGAEAALASARAAVAAAAATETYTNLRAPFDGLVTERLTDPGNLAAPGIPLLRIESDGARQVVARVDEARAAYIQAGNRVRVQFEIPDSLATGDNGIDGVVAEVARAIGADQHAFTIKVGLPREVTVRTGSFARIVFRGAPRRAVVVPAGAVQRHGQVASVFVVQNGVARLRLLQLGAYSPEGIEVLSGLDAGESIVTSPLAPLVDGHPVVTGSAPADPRGVS